jgi:glycosyltransferase involved in cell wall biosynthesis
MATADPTPDRIRIDGKFFRLGSGRFHVKGITYGPFAPNSDGEMFPSREQTARDLAQIRELGANLLRLYYVPPRWFLDLAAENHLKVLIDIPWSKHLCFLDSRSLQNEARAAVRRAATDCKGHPAIFALSVVNEIGADIVRWSGVKRVEKFIDQLVRDVKAIDPAVLCTFTSFPPSEFLQPQEIDFHCFNVYLHHRPSFEAYLARLQTLADSKPLLLGEFGMDSIREGEAHKQEFLAWQIEAIFRAGLAGCVLFSYTDDWFRGGMQIEDWGFGLTTRDRKPKGSFDVVRHQFQIAPHFPLAKSPKVSVIVATYNGSRTLADCLEALGKLNYPDYEIILVDDGSTDRVPEIAKQFLKKIRYVRQENQGLSAARNAGIIVATGEIVAFTDDDCMADEDWLYYLVNDLLSGDCVAIGGHNFLPPEDSPVAAAVVVSPGGPAHVLLTDREAEHIPGCNMAFYKWALLQIGMFDPIFRKAGDDVDVCWRLRDAGLKIGFSHAGFVWHYRRSTVKAYLKQQVGYGEAEALLIGKHPEHYNDFGGGIWHGHIYASSFTGLLLSRSRIYHGIFASGFFQRLYAANPVPPFMYATGLGYHLAVNLPLLLLACYWDFFVPIALASVAASAGVCVVAAAQAVLPRKKQRWWSRTLVALLFFLQPIVRGWARLKWRFTFLSRPKMKLTEKASATKPIDLPATAVFWSDGSTDRLQFLQLVLRHLESAGWILRTDTGWASHDLEVFPHLWTRLTLTTVTEDLEKGRRNFRCRVNASWSLPARVLMTCAAVAVALIIFNFATAWPLAWFSLVPLPLVLWIIEDQAEHDTRLLFASLRSAAEERHCTELV